MGLDVRLFVRAPKGFACTLYGNLYSHVSSYNIVQHSDFAPEGATHVIDTYFRYYDEIVSGGPWPMISALILSLYAENENIEVMWYGGDNGNNFNIVTPEFLDKINRFWIENGNRPYYKK